MVGTSLRSFAQPTKIGLMTSPKSLSRSALVSANTIVSSLLAVQTSGAGFTDLTSEVAKFVREAQARDVDVMVLLWFSYCLF